MQNDVNGIAWCLADYLPDLGVKYFSIGSNNHRALVPFDRPTLYRWESPSGKGMLMFRSDHYHTGNSWGIHTGDMARLEDGVFGYIRNLKRTGYPFPVIAVQYSGYLTDNSPPSMRECDLIRAWNERYAWPKLRSATAHEFLGRIDSQYGDKLPADVKSEAESKLADLKTAVQSGSIDDIKAKQEALSQVFEKMYQAAAAAQQAAGAQPGPDAGAPNNQQKPNDDGVVDADFKEV